MRKYWMMALAVALGALLGGALLTTPASAQPDADALITATHSKSECGKIEITFTNTTADTYDADVRVGEQVGVPDADMPDKHNHGVTPDQLIASGRHAGKPFGLRYTPVLVPAGKTVVYPVEVDVDTTVSYRVWRGPENDYYVDWVDVDVDACVVEETPSPTPPSTSPTSGADPTSSPTSSPTPGATAEPSTTPSAAPSAEAAPELPVTGSNLTVVLGGVAVLLGLTGGGLMVLARRRRTTFRAE